MKLIKSKAFLTISTVFLLVAIPITTYVVIQSEKSLRNPEAATICEKDCNSSETAESIQPNADIDGNGQIGIGDATIVINNMGQKGENIADLNDDGVVSEADLVIIQNQWKP